MPHHTCPKALLQALTLLTALSLLTSSAQAQDPKEEQAKEAATQTGEPGEVIAPPKEGWRSQFSLAYRTVPLGLALFNDTGYRKLLSDSDSLLLKNTYIEGGAYTITSPAYFRSGLYLESVPLSVLQLRTSIQAAKYYGTYGFLLTEEDGSAPDWSLDNLDEIADKGNGVAGSVFYWETRATPRIKAGRVVALAEMRYLYLMHNTEKTTYEPFYDMLFEPRDHYITFKPTLGFLPIQNDDTYLLTAARYDYARVFGNDLRTSQINALVIWGLPKSWVKTPALTLTGLFGYWLKHPEGRANTTYFALQVGATFGAR